MSARAPTERPPPREAVVIDVGSNSVRLVIYRLDGRAMTAVFNEKVMAGLGRNLGETGALSPAGVTEALKALLRFSAIIEARKPASVDAVATAAVRDAADGAQFVARVRRETGIALRVIDGAEEARLSALGVLAGAPEARGVVGDLGGSSLELIALTGDGPGQGETFRLGHLALAKESGFNYATVADTADAALSASEVLTQSGKDFYAVGGAWRAIGRIDVALNRHPIAVLHHHEMPRADAFKVIEFIRKQSKRSLQTLEEAAAKRADSLPYAAVVMERVLTLGDFQRVVLSSYGLREGLLYERLTAQERTEHPLLAAADAFARQAGRASDFGAALANWIEPLFAQAGNVFGAERDRIVRAAAARLADVGAVLHPDQRAELMFDLIARAPLAAISHPERAFLAAAIHHRHTKSASTAPAYERLLDDEGRRAAIALGAALRLGADVSARSPVLLRHVRLEKDAAGLALIVAPGATHLISEQAIKRLEALGAALGAPVNLREDQV
ncbi:MAG: Ppx/GppA family phosphatase [Alphaproteobacteria bacterium]|nr:Ppx/GppA family phosphatase [Alphaproteobacteria bacterium]